MNPKIDAYLRDATKWREEIAALRAIALDSRTGNRIVARAPAGTGY